MMTATAPSTGRVARVRASLTRSEWVSLGGMALFILALHVIGWGVLMGVVAPHAYVVNGTVFGFGLGLTAYVLGMRHAFDADHIAAIDNTTRKLMADGTRPLSVGFWFSLGHSSVVFVLVALLAFGVKALASQLSDGSSTLETATRIFGTSVSGVFLLLIGVLNLVIFVGIAKVFRRMRHGELDEAALEDHLNNRGLMNRFLGRVTRAVSKPWHMYPTGVLFGLGFDTVTEVGLLVIAGGAAAVELPWYAVLTLPILFAAGMSLLDTIDGCFMNFAYGWAFSKPVRKVFYNLTITGLSVFVALVIGGIEVTSVLVGRAGITTGPLAAVARLDLNSVGYTIVGLFVVAWLVAVGIWKYGRIEEKWTAGLATGADDPTG